MVLQLLHNLLRLFAACNLHLFPFAGSKAGSKDLFRACGGKLGIDGPVFLLHKVADFLFAVDNQLDDHRLHPACRQTRLDRFPQEGTELIAHQAVEDAAGLLRVDQVDVDVARSCHTAFDAGLGNLVKGNAAFFLAAQIQHIRQVPGDCLSLAVRVGGKINKACVLGSLFQLVAQLTLAADVDIFRCKIVFDVHTQTAFGQITHMTHRSHDLIALAQIFLDGLCLCRRLHDYQLILLLCRSALRRCLGTLGLGGCLGLFCSGGFGSFGRSRSRLFWLLGG